MQPTTKDYLFVSIQLLLFLAYLFDVILMVMDLPPLVAKIGLAASIIGVLVSILALLQLNRHLSPFPTPKADGQLIQTGLYKYIRHPIYTGILLMVFGYALYGESLYRLIVAAALLILFYLKSSYEEERLMQVYPEYETYRKSTGRFFPIAFA